MPCKIRIEYPGAIGRVMSRGDQPEKLFLDAADQEPFVSILGEVRGKTAWQARAAEGAVDCGALGDGHAGLSEPPALTP